jgi:adenylate cyclase class IV
MTNIEFKARLRNFTKVYSVLAQHHIALTATLRHTDTYFYAPDGRLKLREINDETAQLIFYQRPDRAEVKRSEYMIAPVASPAALCEVLGAAYGIRTVVKKTRELYLLPRQFGAHAGRAAPDLIRLHLDTLDGSGCFLEIEVIVQDGEGPQIAEQEAQFWLREFDIGPEDLLSWSYADLLKAQRP